MPEQRRLVSVLFADVTASTELNELLDPEQVRTLMSRYYEIARDVVVAHGGTVEKFIGDEVMAVFGIPQAHGDDAERAASAALAIRDAVASDSLLGRLALHIGINTGEVVASVESGVNEFLVTGDPVNTAARLRNAAQPGQIIAGDATHWAVPSFRYGAPIELALRGKANPVRAWPVLGRGERGGVSAFVDREADLEQLHLTARRAFHERRPQLVTITAPAGIGKTRVIHEFLAQVKARDPRVAVEVAQCVPYGRTLTYWPLRVMLLRLAGLEQSADAASIRRAVLGLMSGENSERDADLITLTVAPSEGPEQRNQDQIFAAWTRLLEQRAQVAPLALVFEDLHWASDSLLDLVDYLMQPHIHEPLLILTVARPELMSRRPGWGGGRRNHLHLALEPLDDSHVATLVRQLVRADAPATLTSAIVERAEGNPFFAGELVRKLADQPAGGLDNVVARDELLAGLPSTVHATVLARLDTLSDDERSVLQAAAIVGRTFSMADVQPLTALDATPTDAALRRLVDRDLLVPSRGAEEYSFRHILIREVAYQTLSRSRRARDHAVLAGRYEAQVGTEGERLAELIALHFLEATRLRAASALEDPTAHDESVRVKAVTWLARAARLGAAAGASSEAVRQLRDAIALATPMEELALQEQLGDALVVGLEAVQAFERAIFLWRQLRGGDATGARLFGRYLHAMERWAGTIPLERRPPEEQLEQMNAEAFALAERSGDELAMGMALLGRSLSLNLKGERRRRTAVQCRDEAGQAAAIFERHDEPQWLSASLDALCVANADLGEFQAARAVARRRLGLVDRIASPAERMDTSWMAGRQEGDMGDARAGLMTARQALSVRAVGSALRLRVLALGEVAHLATMAGEWDEVVAAAREALEVWESQGRPFGPHASRGFVNAVYVARRRGLDDLVSELLPFVTMEKRASGDAMSAIVLVRGGYLDAVLKQDPELAEPAFARFEQSALDLELSARPMSYGERLNAFLAAYRTSLRSADRCQEIAQVAERKGLLPLAAQLMRQRSLAVGGSVGDLTRAREILRDAGMTPDAALTEIEIAALTGDRDLLRRAATHLTQLGDQVGLERVRVIDHQLSG